MHEHQLHELRREQWRLNGRPLRTLDEAREFVDSVGFCLLYAQRTPVLLPTFVGAWKGSDEKLPTGAIAFADPDAAAGKDLMVRLLREKSAYEANVFPDNNFILSAAVFPYFYALVGDRNARHTPKSGPRSEYSPLAVHAFELIQKEGPISKHRLQERLGGEISEAALDRVLDELWARLRITRVDYKPEEGVFWDVLSRWSPQAVKEGSAVPVNGALTALVAKYLECVVAVSQEELEQFFSHFVGRARVREAVNALQAARELKFVHVGGRVMLQSADAPQLAVRDTPPYSATSQVRPGRPLVDRRGAMPKRKIGPTRNSAPPPRQDSGTK